MSNEEITSRTRLLDNDIKVMKSDVMRISHELQSQADKIKENTEKIKVNKTLPYLVSNVIELLDVDPQDTEEDGAVVDLDSQRKGKCAVIKTSTRQVSSQLQLLTIYCLFLIADVLYFNFRHTFYPSLVSWIQNNLNRVI